MYENKVAAPLSQCDTVAQPQINLLLEESAGINGWQRELISVIENKLHNLLNLRRPDKDKENVAKPIVEDFVSAMKEKQQEAKDLCQRLEKIAQHLSVLVG